MVSRCFVARQGLMVYAGLADSDEYGGPFPIHSYELEDLEVSKVMGVPWKGWSIIDSPIEAHDFGGGSLNVGGNLH